MSHTVTRRGDKPVRVVYPIPATEAGAARVEGPGTDGDDLSRAIENAAGRAGECHPFPLPGRARAPITMHYPEPRGRWVAPALWWLAGLCACCAWDRAVWLFVSDTGRARWAWLKGAASVKGLWESIAYPTMSDLAGIGRTLAVWAYALGYFAGTMWPWLVLAVIVIFRGWLSTRPGAAMAGVGKGLFVIAVTGVAGGSAELLKLVVRRLRPDASDGWYIFRAYSDRPLSAEDLGLASSHAAIAVAAALVVGGIYPRVRWLLWALAPVCAIGRVLVGAHFVSDIYVGSTLAVVAALVMHRLAGPRSQDVALWNVVRP